MATTSQTLNKKEKTTMSKKIVQVADNGNGYLALLTGKQDTTCIGGGVSAKEALGDLVCSHPDKFNIKIEAD
jgi:hypothetical protein